MLLWMTILTYSASGLFAISNAFAKAPIAHARKIYLGFALLGLLCHSAALTQELVVQGMLQMSLLNSISVCVWMTIAVILLSSLTKPLDNLLMFFMPAAAILLVFALAVPQLAEPKPYSAGMLLHIFGSLLAYSVIIICTLQAILVNIQSNHLHRHELNHRIFRVLPPLESMERLMFEWLFVGFILLTIAMISGGIYVENLLAQHLIHKSVLTLISWGFFAVLIFGHFYLGWRGQRASRLIYLGFGFLLVAFVGSKFVLEYLLAIA